MDTSTEAKLNEIEAKVDDMHRLLKKMRLYSRISFWITVVVIVGPLLLLPFVIPFFLSSLSLPADTGSGTTTGTSAADLTKLLSQLGI